MTVSEKIAYLKGLCAGLEHETETKTGKLLVAIVETLEVMGAAVADIEENAASLGNEIDMLNEDIAEIEQAVFEDDEDGDDEDEDEDEVLFEVKCPACEESITIDESILNAGGIKCPGCGEMLEFDLGCEDPDCNCHHHE